MNFDKNGFLTPYQPIVNDLGGFQTNFAFNEHRFSIFDHYLELIERIKALSINTFEHWLNGSFVSKKEKPNDLDILMFISVDDFFLYEKALAILRQEYKNKHLDLFYIIKRDETDANFNLFQSDYVEWLHLFSKTRRNLRTGIRNNKGFIQINYNFDEK